MWAAPPGAGRAWPPCCRGSSGVSPPASRRSSERYPNNEPTGQATAVAAVPESDTGSDPTAVAAAPPTAVEEPMPVSRRRGRPTWRPRPRCSPPPRRRGCADPGEPHRPLGRHPGLLPHLRVQPESGGHAAGLPHRGGARAPTSRSTTSPCRSWAYRLSGEYSFPLASRDDGRPALPDRLVRVFGRGQGPTHLRARGHHGQRRFRPAHLQHRQGQQRRPQPAAGRGRLLPARSRAACRLGSRSADLRLRRRAPTTCICWGWASCRAYFPYITGSGGEGYAASACGSGPSWRCGPPPTSAGLRVRHEHPAGGPREAAGAVDQYLGFNLAVALRD